MEKEVNSLEVRHFEPVDPVARVICRTEEVFDFIHGQHSP